MESSNTEQRDYQRIEKALGFVAENYRQQPTLSEIAAEVHLSEHHFQRLFQRWAGVSPKQFLQYLTLQHASDCLAAGMSTLDTTYEVGLAAPARLGELFIRLEALTPGEFKTGGAGLEIQYGFHQSRFGKCLVGVPALGICGLHFVAANTEEEEVFTEFKARLPNAVYTRNQSATATTVAQIFNSSEKSTLSLLVGGTPFQLKVWEALLRIPTGHRVSYQQLAQSIDKPGAMRAVGTAVGCNPVAVLIPCHRVIRGDGQLGGYRWGLGRKLAVQGWESTKDTANLR